MPRDVAIDPHPVGLASRRASVPTQPATLIVIGVADPRVLWRNVLWRRGVARRAGRWARQAL